MKNLILTLLIICSFVSHGQEVKTSKEILNIYISKLDLTKGQTNKFKLIYDNFKPQLNQTNISDKEFNKINKLRDLEFYNILSKEQFGTYKEVKQEIESELKFRFKQN